MSCEGSSYRRSTSSAERGGCEKISLPQSHLCVDQTCGHLSCQHWSDWRQRGSPTHSFLARPRAKVGGSARPTFLARVLAAHGTILSGHRGLGTVGGRREQEEGDGRKARACAGAPAVLEPLATPVRGDGPSGPPAHPKGASPGTLLTDNVTAESQEGTLTKRQAPALHPGALAPSPVAPACGAPAFPLQEVSHEYSKCPRHYEPSLVHVFGASQKQVPPRRDRGVRTPGCTRCRGKAGPGGSDGRCRGPLCAWHEGERKF